MPNEIRGKIELWIGCIAGALEDHEYETSWTRWVQKNEIEPTRVYDAAQAKELLCGIGPEANRITAAVDGKFASHSFGHKTRSSLRGNGDGGV